MGMRLRKSIKVGKNSRINLSKSGVGFSTGTKGFRVAKKAGGGTRTSLSIPGTGISYVKDSRKKSVDSREKSVHSSGIPTTDKNPVNPNGPEEPKKRKTWLWVLGWIFIFPLPLTILLRRKKSMNAVLKYGIIAAAWVLYFLIAAPGGSNTKDNDKTGTRNNTRSRIESETAVESEAAVESEVAVSENNIKDLSFLNDEDITLKVGESASGQIKVSVKKKSESLSDEIELISENTDVAAIVLVDDSHSAKIDYRIEAIGAGETKIYARTKDGSVYSEKISVSVTAPVAVESIILEGMQDSLILGEKIQAVAKVMPENAEDQTVTWASSDENVITVDQDGFIAAVGGGTATITAAASNGVMGTVDVNVDGTKRIMELRVSSSRQDDNNIGHEWSKITMVNGEPTTQEYELSVGDTIECYARYTEDDKDPDIGEASASYIITEDDLVNGFTISMDLYVTENGGRNIGESAYYIVNFAFTVK